MYRFLLVSFLAFSSMILISAKFSKDSAVFEKYHSLPPFSGGPGTGGLGDRTGSPLSAAGTCAACHSGGNFNVSVSVEVVDPVTSNVVTSYVPGNTYQVNFTLSGNAGGYGFQSGVLTSSNAAGGTFSSSSPDLQVLSISGRPYVEHTGVIPSGVFQVSWTAPAANSGDVTFYAIGIGANGNGGTSGDNVASPVSLTLSEEQPTFSSLKKLLKSSLTVFPNPVIDVFKIEKLDEFETIESIHLLDGKGNLVLDISSASEETNISHLESGVYYVQVKSESNVSYISLVKK